MEDDTTTEERVREIAERYGVSGPTAKVMLDVERREAGDADEDEGLPLASTITGLLWLRPQPHRRLSATL